MGKEKPAREGITMSKQELLRSQTGVLAFQVSFDSSSWAASTSCSTFRCSRSFLVNSRREDVGSRCCSTMDIGQLTRRNLLVLLTLLGMRSERSLSVNLISGELLFVSLSLFIHSNASRAIVKSLSSSILPKKKLEKMSSLKQLSIYLLSSKIRSTRSLLSFLNLSNTVTLEVRSLSWPSTFLLICRSSLERVSRVSSV